MGILDVLLAMNMTPAERRQSNRVSQLQQAIAQAAVANAQRERLDDLRSEATSGQLREIIRAQDEQLGQLTCALGVLVQMLAETGTLDEEDFRWRVEATLVNTEAEPGAAVAPDEPTITCRNCQQVVPRKDSEITARGVMCERCALAASF